ncbi:hypothetical protein COT97_02145 [Candidatus Falkowbacteria bacterium CG10_big_fil_rev_8_21_14_0_10_39_11]|uniref:Transcription regulator TrmB N-terminal domain-containing protein n=1 Tax=Candidatus Falkowbacteria bacterium CG10_big_fil_rev_8_21_14_0_10_39_11 TaxID=1974565 RepID=A0A2H0V7F2_9BACT|nr:MAG: hypothetical protein COT97_02145 [Candidatus Falkowbacteria bacterium CG10_big_fil_rev_8_21_14_0_10_39_11]
MYQQQLINIGLLPKEAKVYETLLNLGPNSITSIYQKSNLKKGDTYNVLHALKEKKLITEKIDRGKTLFLAEPPQKIESILRNKQKQLEAEKAELENLLPDLTTLFQTTTDKPIIQTQAGIEGMENFYEKILHTKNEVLIFVSKYDRDDHDMEKLIDRYTLKQYRKGIKLRALNPIDPQYSKSSHEDYLKDRHDKNITVRFISKKFTFPSQIIVFDNTIGITSLKNDVITTVIDNPDIAHTFKTLFEYMWLKAGEDHDKLIK